MSHKGEGEAKLQQVSQRGEGGLKRARKVTKPNLTKPYLT